jgi:hypothetical protein
MSEKYIIQRRQWVAGELNDEEFIGPFDTAEEANWFSKNTKPTMYHQNDEVIQLRTVK